MARWRCVVTANVFRRSVALALPIVLLSACQGWITDFKQQPSVGTWQEFKADSGELQGFRGQPAGSVNTNGTLMADWQVSHSNLPVTIDSMSGVQNPVAVDERSLASGRKYFSINCAVCHGDLGDGNGALKQLSPMYAFPPSLLMDITKNRTDGYIWGMMRNGRGLMAAANRIEETERWDVVNYVRGLQGRYPVATGPVGRPGETGDKLPGFTKLGPQVPSQYFHPVVTERPIKKAEGAEGAPAAKPEGN